MIKSCCVFVFKLVLGDKCTCIVGFNFFFRQIVTGVGTLAVIVDLIASRMGDGHAANRYFFV